MVEKRGGGDCRSLGVAEEIGGSLGSESLQLSVERGGRDIRRGHQKKDGCRKPSSVSGVSGVWQKEREKERKKERKKDRQTDRQREREREKQGSASTSTYGLPKTALGILARRGKSLFHVELDDGKSVAEEIAGSLGGESLKLSVESLDGLGRIGRVWFINALSLSMAKWMFKAPSAWLQGS